MRITKIHARQIFNSRGNPTVECDLWLGKYFGRASVPTGASTGIHEAWDLHDGRKEYFGRGVKIAVNNINITIAKHVKNKSFTQKTLDDFLIKLDGTKNKHRLGANAILAVSMAFAKAAAQKRPLYSYLSQFSKKKMVLPIPFFNIINGGKHAGGKLPFQEFMIAPVKAKSFSEAMRIGSEVYHMLKKEIGKKYGKVGTNVGDEGGFAPPIRRAEQALNLIIKAVNDLGYEDKVKIAMDCAASEFYRKKRYVVGRGLSARQLMRYYEQLINDYPIISMEDPFSEDDFNSFQQFMDFAGKKIQVVGDDLLVTNIERIQMAVERNLCNALLLKVNQIGSVSEAIQAANLALKNKWGVMVSHRSGETDETFIADLAVGLGINQIKAGAPCRGERLAKYNRLLRIEEELGRKVCYAEF